MPAIPRQDRAVAGHTAATAEGSWRSPQTASLLDAWDVPAALISPTFSILATNRAYDETFRGGDAPERSATGRKCHEVSHRYRVPCSEMGEACPLGQAAETGAVARALHVHWTRSGRENHEIRIVPLLAGEDTPQAFLEIIQPLRQVSAEPAGHGLVGHSESFRKALSLITRVAPSEASVLLLGETGTGKELLAQTVHDLSRRHEHSFVVLDCSGLTETLFESELFGHEKGAFTGAVGRKRGLVEAALGGTLFLDEVGDIPLSLQVKFLRLLECGTFRRVGSTDELQADFRLVCATHQNLVAKVERGEFRRDLFYRISAFPVPVPPLRDRRSDIPLIACSLLQRLKPGSRRTVTDEALEALAGHNFPGNVRELRNLLERAAVLAGDGPICLEHLPDDLVAGGDDPPAAAVLTLAEQEIRYLTWARRQHRGDMKSLANALGISERTLYRKLGASTS